MNSATTPASGKPIHPLWMRITHWLNALAVLVLVTSGWRIYNAAPFFPFTIPGSLTLGGWLGGALQWHFAAMWLLGFNGIVYLALNIASGRLGRKFFPVSPKAVWHDGIDALKGKLSHADPRRYNAVQKLAYLFVMLDLTLLVLSGMVLFKSVQFPLLARPHGRIRPCAPHPLLRHGRHRRFRGGAPRDGGPGAAHPAHHAARSQYRSHRSA